MPTTQNVPATTNVKTITATVMAMQFNATAAYKSQVSLLCLGRNLWRPL